MYVLSREIKILTINTIDLSITNRQTIVSPLEDLLDLAVSGSQLWLLTSNRHGEVSLRRWDTACARGWELTWLAHHQELYILPQLDQFCPQDLFSQAPSDDPASTSLNASAFQDPSSHPQAQAQEKSLRNLKRVAQFFLDRIFLQNRFLPWVIEERLQTLQQRLHLDLTPYASKTLRQLVSLTICQQIELAAQERDLDPQGDAMFQLVCDAWLEFIQSCMDLSRLLKSYLGLGACGEGGICLIKTSALSCIQPCDPFQRLLYTSPEHLSEPANGLWSPHFLSIQPKHDYSPIPQGNGSGGGRSVDKDVDNLLSATRLFAMLTQNELGPVFAGIQGKIPLNINEKVTQHIEAWLFENEIHEARIKHRRMDANLTHLLSTLSEPRSACTKILSLLNPTFVRAAMARIQGQGDHKMEEKQDSQEAVSQLELEEEFKSGASWLVESICSSFRQIIWSRFTLVKELYVFFTYVCHVHLELRSARSNSPVDHEHDLYSFIQTTVLPDLLALLKAYNILHWLGNVTSSLPSVTPDPLDDLDSLDLDMGHQLSQLSLHRQSPVQASHGDHKNVILVNLCRKLLQSQTGAFQNVIYLARLGRQTAVTELTFCLLNALSVFEEPKQSLSLPSSSSSSAAAPSSSSSSLPSSAVASKIDHAELIIAYLDESRQYQALLEFVHICSLSSVYRFQEVIGRAHLSLLNLEEACECFIVLLSRVDVTEVLTKCHSLLHLFSQRHRGKEKYFYFLKITFSVIERMTLLRAAEAQKEAAHKISEGFNQENHTFHETHLQQLWSAVFEYSIALATALQDNPISRAQFYDHAYAALLAVDSPATRLHLLKRFVGLLSSQGEVEKLCSYQWAKLRGDVEAELQRKARITPLYEQTICNYYNILYCFFVEAGNYRGAAECVWAYACRVEREQGLLSVHSLRLYSDALLMVLNALQLCPRHQWLLTPSLSAGPQGKTGIGGGNATKKFKSGGPALGLLNGSGGGKVLTLEDLQSKSDLCEAQITLCGSIRVQSDENGAFYKSLAGQTCYEDVLNADGMVLVARHTQLDLYLSQRLEEAGIRSVKITAPLPNKLQQVAEVVDALLLNGSIQTAVSLALRFQIELIPVFRRLALICVKLQISPNRAQVPFDNRDLPGLAFSVSESGSFVQTNRHLSRCDQAWNYLQRLLIQHDTQETNFEYRLVVAEAILEANSRMVLPMWLVNEIKQPSRSVSSSLSLSTPDLDAKSERKSEKHGGPRFARSGANILPLLKLLFRKGQLLLAADLAVECLSTDDDESVVNKACTSKALGWPLFFLHDLKNMLNATEANLQKQLREQKQQLENDSQSLSEKNYLQGLYHQTQNLSKRMNQVLTKLAKHLATADPVKFSKSSFKSGAGDVKVGLYTSANTSLSLSQSGGFNNLTSQGGLGQVKPLVNTIDFSGSGTGFSTTGTTGVGSGFGNDAKHSSLASSSFSTSTLSSSDKPPVPKFNSQSWGF